MKKSVLASLLVMCSFLYAEFETQGVLSIGKFYTYSASPSTSYPDVLSCLNYSDGTKLTDEILGDSYPLSDWVAWYDQDVEITVDLGQVYQISSIKLHSASRSGWSIHFPESMNIYYKESQGDSWSQYGSGVNVPSDTVDWSVQWLSGNGGNVDARYIMFDLKCQSGEFLFTDQLEVYGTIRNSWKNVPAWGCLHGAYHVDSQNNKRYEDFEIRSGKTLAMILSYLEMEPNTSFSDLEYMWSSGLTSNSMDTDRLLSMAWLPDDYSSQDIAEGDLDSYYYQWFSDAASSSYLNTRTVWLRPMNEMNGGWVAWGLDPNSYRQAWRRMYNIAEQTGATDKLIFVWSPNYRSFPDETWNSMDNYYPGDSYVDWVGLSLYPPTASPCYPTDLLSEIYSLYGDYKPMIISEGSFNTDHANIDCVDWTYEWFDSIKNTYPMVKAAIWENHLNRRIESSPETTAAYRYGVGDPYFLPSPNFWQEDFRGINGNVVSSAYWSAASGSTDDTAWKASDDYNDGLAAAYTSLMSSGNSDIYCEIAPEAGDNYAIGGNLVDYLETNKQRGGGVKLWFEARVDVSNGNILRNGWSVYLTRVHTSPTSWYDSIGIKDPSGNNVAAKYIGSPGSKKVIPFVFRRNADHVEIKLGDLVYSATESYNSANKHLRMYYYASGTATSASPLLGVTGLTVSSEWAVKDTFFAVNGPLAGENWKPTSDCNVAEIWKACTSYPLYNNKPAAYAGNCYTGVSELYKTIPLDGDSYRLTGNLIDFVTSPVDRGSTLRVYVESDVNESNGQVQRQGWKFEIYRVHTDPTNWYTGYRVTDPNGISYSQYVGKPSSVYSVPFSFERSGNDVYVEIGGISHSASEVFDADNKEIRIHYGVGTGSGEDHTFFGISDLKLIEWEEDFYGIDALLTTDLDWKQADTSDLNKWYADNDYFDGSSCAYAGGIYGGDQSSDVYTSIPASESYKITGDIIDFDTICDTTGLIQVRVESDVNTSTDQVIRSGWRLELKRDYTNSSQWKDKVRVFDPSLNVVLSFDTDKDQDSDSGIYSVPFSFERNGSEVIVEIGGHVYVGFENYSSVNDQMILCHYKNYNPGGDSTNFGVANLEILTWDERFDKYDGSIYADPKWTATADRDGMTNCYKAFTARDFYDDSNPYLEKSAVSKVVELDDPQNEFAELYTEIPQDAGNVYKICGKLIDFGQPVQQTEACMTVFLESAVDSSGDVTRQGWQISLQRYYSSYSSSWISVVKVVDPSGSTVKTQYIQNASSSMLRVPFEFKRTGNDIEISFSYGASGGYTHTATETYNQSNRVVSMLYEVGYEQGVDKYTQMGTGDIRILFTP